MKNKTFECPYLTEEDKEFLKYELKVYEKNFYLLPMKFLFRGISYIAVAYRFNI